MRRKNSRSKSPGPKSIRPSDKNRLFALSRNSCSYPKCSVIVASPDRSLNLIDVCHIEAAAEDGGARYSPAMDDEARRSFDNLILLCPTHHRETDDESIFTVAELKRMRQCHFDKVPYPLPAGPINHRRLKEMKEEEDAIISQITDIRELLSKFYCRDKWIPNEFVRTLPATIQGKLANNLSTMSLDRIQRVRRFIILIKGTTVTGEPCLLHHYSGIRVNGWRTWLLPSLDRNIRVPGDFRQQLEKHIYVELGLTKETVGIHELPFFSICLKTNRFAPRKELKLEAKLYCFRYCYAMLSSIPTYLRKQTMNIPNKSYRRLKWFFTDSLMDEDGQRMYKANSDVIKTLVDEYAHHLDGVPVAAPDAPIQM